VVHQRGGIGGEFMWCSSEGGRGMRLTPHERGAVGKFMGKVILFGAISSYTEGLLTAYYILLTSGSDTIKTMPCS